MGDRIVVLKDGHVQQIDTPLNLYNKPVNQFVAGFIGSPAMNFVEGRIDGGAAPQFVARDAAFTMPVPGPAQPRDVVLGIRPEDIYVEGSRFVDHPTHTLDAVVDVLEPMGNEIFVYAHAGPHALVARVAPQELPDVGAPIKLALDRTKLHFFDKETGETLPS